MIKVVLKGDSAAGLSNDPVEMDLTHGTVEELFLRIDIQKEILDQLILLVNGRIASHDVQLKEGDEVLLHLPVSGG